MSNNQSTSSPIATGGSGTFFEQHVGAQFLALLLVRGIPPILKECQVKEVHFQTEHLGFDTDDLLIIGEGSEKKSAKLIAQVKRSFTISTSDDSCRKVFTDFWKDYNKDQFNPAVDRLALITLRGTNVLLDKFNSLLDCARASVDSSDFEHRLQIKGFLSKKSRKQAQVIRTIIEEEFDQSLSPSEFWNFLRSLQIVSYDLNTKTAQHEAWIKTLLAQTSNEPDSVSSAESTWGELLQIVSGSNGMPAAGSYRYEDLPEKLRGRHSALAFQPGSQLQQLTEHSAITLEGINTKIDGSVKIRREALESKTLSLIEETQVTIITGPAGYGKSVLAKNIVTTLQDDYFCLVFRAEEFSNSHIDQSLKRIQESLTGNQLLGLLSGQARKIVLIESIERLLESSERKAFMDLLRLSRKDKSLKVILTCRDYSLETVKISLLEQIPIQYKVREVPALTDKELEQVSENVDSLSIVFNNPKLKELLRSPYLLNIATRIDWTNTQSLPDSEREFRNRCWREVIRSDVNAEGGMPRKRGKAFRAIALKRAKYLRPFVNCDDLDPSVLEALRKDNLISFSKESQALAAPAHDVLEDWAIIRWIHDQYAIHEGDPKEMANKIGGYPALRRGYRNWLSEILKLEFDKADDFILSAYTDDALPSYFRDDTIICTLLSSSAEEFLVYNRNKLLKDEAILLIRVIHLLRVACKEAPHWLPGVQGLTSQTLKPIGTAWAPVLKIVREEIDTLLPQHLGIIIGLVEDWAKQVAYWNPKPDGYEEAGKIIPRLLEELGDYRSDNIRERVLEIFAKIPESNTDFFESLLKRASENEDDRVATDFVELLLTGFNATYASMFFPKELSELAIEYFCLNDQDIEDARRNPRRHSHSTGVETCFGIKDNIQHKFSVPSSAIRGPFYSLLQFHPKDGIKLIIQLINHACLWYGEQKWPYKSLEPAFKTELIISDEKKVEQWINGRLYGIYRGATVAPYVLQSALMALEKWLLLIAEQDEVDLETILVNLLKQSNNVAITAVVASVCIAHPSKSGRASLVLIANKDILRLDRSRMANDRSNTSMSKLMPSFQAEHKIYDQERVESDSLSHRKGDLESLAIRLQLSDVKEQVWEIIDQHRKDLPPQEKQTEDDRQWRLVLHRIDTRGFDIKEIPSSEVKGSNDSDEDDENHYFQFIPTKIESDVQKLVDENEERMQETSEDLSLVNWGRSAWKRDLDDNADDWRKMLSLAKDRDCKAFQNDQESKDDFLSFSKGGPGFIAAVCVRDHLENLDAKDRSWCIKKLISLINEHKDTDNYDMILSRGAMAPDRFAAYALPRVIQDVDIKDIENDVLTTLASSITHSVPEVREYAAEGIGNYLQDKTDFILRYASALVKQIQLVNDLQEKQDSKEYHDRLSVPEIVQSTGAKIRNILISGDIELNSEFTNWTLDEWASRPILKLIVCLFSNQTKSDIAIKFHRKLAYLIAEEWRRDEQNRYSGNRRDFDFEYWCANRIARFCLKLTKDKAIIIYEPILNSIEEQPGEVATFVNKLIYEEDSTDENTPYWQIWEEFANKCGDSQWIGKLDEERYYYASEGKKLIRNILFGIQWKEDILTWRKVEGEEYRIDNFVRDIPITAATFKFYCRFLYKIGNNALPRSFKTIHDLLEKDNSSCLDDRNTRYYIESILRRYVYGEPIELKKDPSIRKAVIFILDELVEAGSSAAYQMRDDFVTPLSP